MALAGGARGVLRSLGGHRRAGAPGAHTDPDLLPDDLRLGQFTLAGDGGSELTELPGGWTQDQAWSRRTGDLWLRGRTSCVLAVPSALLPEEKNYVFNPLHPASAGLRKVGEREFRFDARLL